MRKRKRMRMRRTRRRHSEKLSRRRVGHLAVNGKAGFGKEPQ